uniref:Uncharacterized protein n=1 Tax=Setaria italica TaxID=4555 RepID=K4A4K3_SETIT
MMGDQNAELKFVLNFELLSKCTRKVHLTILLELSTLWLGAHKLKDFS